MNAVLRDQDEVRVMHAEAVNDQPDPERVELTLEGPTNHPHDLRHPGEEGGWYVDEVIDVILWDYEALARPGRSESHEPHHLVVLEDPASRGPPCGDLTKNTLGPHGSVASLCLGRGSSQ